MWMDVEGTTMVAACGPPGGGRQEVTPRLLRHFTMLCVPQVRGLLLPRAHVLALGLGPGPWARATGQGRGGILS